MRPFAFFMNDISTGAYESKKDKRDYQDPDIAFSYPYPIQARTDIDRLFVEYQRKVGACTASLKTYIEWLYYKKTGTYVRLSMAFLYIVTKRFIDKNKGEGSSLRSALKAATKYGVCTEETFPSNFALTHAEFVDQEIPQSAFTEALNYTIGGYINIPIERSLMCAAIDKYGLLYVRFDIDSHWWLPSWSAKDILPLKAPLKGMGTGHAVLLNGYDLSDVKEKIEGRNTWSVTWADKGNFYTFLTEYQPTEAWAVTLDSQSHLQVDNSPTVPEKVWRRVLQVLREIGLIH